MSNTQENKNEGPGHSKEFTIIVNGRAKVVAEKEMTVAEIIALAFDVPPTGENVIYTITFRRGEGNKPEGSLLPDETVKIKEGMIFNVTPTYKS